MANFVRCGAVLAASPSCSPRCCPFVSSAEPSGSSTSSRRRPVNMAPKGKFKLQKLIGADLEVLFHKVAATHNLVEVVNDGDLTPVVIVQQCANRNSQSGMKWVCVCVGERDF